MLKIAFAQINPTVGAFDENYKKIFNFIQRAKATSVDILIFPELSISGCPPKDLLLKEDFVKKNLEILQKIKNSTDNIAVALGSIYKKDDKIYNSAFLFYDKKILNIYNKINLLDNTFFDEKNYFSRGDSLKCYQFKKFKFFLTLGEDIFCEKIANYIKKEKVDFVINLAATPFYVEKNKFFYSSLFKVAKSIDSFIFFCNLVGGQDEVVFDGNSCIVSSEGKIVFLCKSFEEDFEIFEFDKKLKYKQFSLSDDKVKLVYEALVCSLRDYSLKNNFKSAILGVSGGIDSAVVTSIATAALGRDNVVGLIMPSRFSLESSVSCAKKICENLKINYKIIDIENIFDMCLKTFQPFFLDKKFDVTEENLQSRIRGMILMAFSNKFGHLVLNTGNKSELFCGYCTLYGDLIGGFSILKDIYKTFVYKLAEYINKITNPPVIPKTVFTKAPSAELRKNQKDTDTLPGYSILDPILKFYLEDNLEPKAIAKKGYDIKLVNKIIKMVSLSEFKRKQAPPGTKITYSAIFKQNDLPITNRFF
ncbi:MAG: NAD+ synthase [Candidatus Omnitrophica bacterium]|nr:NAD+ synthase [Candidatus Omnitrophota bacterium]